MDTHVHPRKLDDATAEKVGKKTVNVETLRPALIVYCPTCGKIYLRSTDGLLEIPHSVNVAGGAK